MATLQYSKDEPWFLFLSANQQALVSTSFLLLEQAEVNQSNLADYSYLVFPFSKAYEGFLKKFLFKLKLINKFLYEDKYFRIGRALNPDVRKRQRDAAWLYDDVSHKCGQEIAKQLWNAWLECRNRIFHFFPGKEQMLTLPQARAKIILLQEAMQTAVACIEK